MSGIDQKLRSAIANKRLVQLRYEGARRVVEPHDYGVQNETPSLLAFQVRSSDPAKKPGWRMLHLSKMSDCVILDETFKGSRGASHRQHHKWDILYARVG
jgi:predicted DNA-binding transcriptional regulator YafY